MFFKFSETSNFDDAPKWDEAQRETVNRNLSIEFDAENTTHETDTTDDASAINRNQKFNQSKVCFLQINWDNGAKYLYYFLLERNIYSTNCSIYGQKNITF